MAYTIKKGDTLGKIAKANNMTLSELLALNPQFRSNPNLIQVGDTVTLTSSETSSGGSKPAQTGPPNSEEHWRPIRAGQYEDMFGSPPPPGTTAKEILNQITKKQPFDLDADSETMSVLSSPNMDWYFDRKTGTYFAKYRLPGLGHQAGIMFEATAEQMKAIFGDKLPQITSGIDSAVLFKEEQYQTVFGGNITEVEGSGWWENEVQRVIALTLDQDTLPEWILKDEGALSLLYLKVADGRSDNWFYEQLSKRQSFKNRYPGLDHLKSVGLTTVEAVRAFTEFETKAKSLHTAAGFLPGAVTPKLVGQLLQRGYSIEQVAESYQVWNRMREHAPALTAFNQVLQAAGHQPLTGNNMYKFLTGQAPQQIYELYEASAIEEAAEASGMGGVFSANDALSLAVQTERDITVDEAYKNFTTAATQALRFRHELNVGQYGLDVEELIDLSFGRAPRSGRSASEVGEILARITNAAQAALERRTQPFTGFTDTGTPQQRSLSGLRPQE